MSRSVANRLISLGRIVPKRQGKWKACLLTEPQNCSWQAKLGLNPPRKYSSQMVPYSSYTFKLRFGRVWVSTGFVFDFFCSVFEVLWFDRLLWSPSMKSFFGYMTSFCSIRVWRRGPIWPSLVASTMIAALPMTIHFWFIRNISRKKVFLYSIQYSL